MPNKQRHAVRGHITATEGAMPTRRPRTSIRPTLYLGGGSALACPRPGLRLRVRETSLRRRCPRVGPVFGNISEECSWFSHGISFSTSLRQYTPNAGCAVRMHSTATTSSGRPRQGARGAMRGANALVSPCSPQTSDPYGVSIRAIFRVTASRPCLSDGQGRTYVHMLIRSANDGVAVT